MEQFIFHTRTAVVDTIASLHDSDREVVLELVTKIHDILDNAVSKHVRNTACILASLFDSAFRQCCEVLASQDLFLHNFTDSVPPSEACLYGCINWSLAQAQQQSSLGLSQCNRSEKWQNQAKGCFLV